MLTMKEVMIPWDRSQPNSMVIPRASCGVTPPPSVNGRCGIRLAPGDRRPRRRRGSAFMVLARPRPSIDGRRRCEKARVGDR
jgi:hypothetical protein